MTLNLLHFPSHTSFWSRIHYPSTVRTKFLFLKDMYFYNYVHITIILITNTFAGHDRTFSHGPMITKWV